MVISAMFTGIGFADSDNPTVVSANTQALSEVADINDLITTAKERNPSIASARAAWKASIENVRIDSALPDPQLALTWFPAPIETRLGPQDWNIMLSQQIPFPKKLTAKKDIAAIGVAVAGLKTDKTYRDIVSKIKIAFYELSYIRKAKKIAGENLRVLKEFQGIAESTYGQDRAIFADVVKAQAQSGQVHYDLLLLEDLEETQVTTLNGLLNRDPQARIGTLSGGMVFPVIPEIDSLFQIAEERQEAISIAKQAIKKAERQKDLAGYSSYPDFKLGVTWSGIGDPDVNSPPPDAGEDAFGIQFGVTIPIWSGKNKGRKVKAQSLIKEKTAVRDEIINKIRTNIRTLYYKTRNAFRQVELYDKDLLPQALRALEVSETWFREGEGAFTDVLESQSAVYNFQLSLARAKSDIGKNIAQLERLIGASISELSEKEGSQ